MRVQPCVPPRVDIWHAHGSKGPPSYLPYTPKHDDDQPSAVLYDLEVRLLLIQSFSRRLFREDFPAHRLVELSFLGPWNSLLISRNLKYYVITSFGDLRCMNQLPAHHLTHFPSSVT